LSNVACVIQRSLMSCDLHLKNHRTTWTLGTKYPNIVNQAYGFAPFTKFQAFRRYSQPLCRYKLILSHPVVLQCSRKITLKTRQSNTSHLINDTVHCYMALHIATWHCILLHGTVHFLGIETRSDVECHLLN